MLRNKHYTEELKKQMKIVYTGLQLSQHALPDCLHQRMLLSSMETSFSNSKTNNGNNSCSNSSNCNRYSYDNRSFIINNNSYSNNNNNNNRYCDNNSSYCNCNSKNNDNNSQRFKLITFKRRLQWYLPMVYNEEMLPGFLQDRARHSNCHHCITSERCIGLAPNVMLNTSLKD